MGGQEGDNSYKNCPGYSPEGYCIYRASRP